MCLLLLASGSGTGVAVDESDRFVTGKDLQLLLRSAADWSCRDAPVSGQLQQLQDLTRMTVVLDRRVDRNHPVTLESGFVSRGKILGKLCDSVPGSGWCATDHVVYVGPHDAAARLPVLLDAARGTVAELRGKLPAAAYRRVLSARAVRREMLSEPRDLVQQAITDAGLLCDNPEQIPHDVWDAAEWPPMPFADSVTLILNQFDLMLSPGRTPASVAVVPIDGDVRLERNYRFDRSQREAVTQSCGQQFPDLRQQWLGSTLRVTASLTQHVWLQNLWQQSASGGPGTTELPPDSLVSRRFSLKVERSTLGQLVEYFRTNGIPVEIPEADEKQLSRILLSEVTLNLKSLPAEQFFTTVFGPYFETVTVDSSRVVLKSPR